MPNITEIKKRMLDKHSGVIAKVKNMKDYAVVEAATIIINEYIKDNPEFTDFSGMIMEQAEIQGSVMKVKVGDRRGLAHVHAPGTEAVQQQTYNGVVTVPLDRISWYTKLDVSELKNDFLNNVLRNGADINKKLAERKLSIIIQTVLTAITSSSTLYAAASTLAKTTFDALIAKMVDESGGIKAIIGRSSTVFDISAFVGAALNTLDYVAREGFLMRYHGGDVLQIGNVQEVIQDGLDHSFRNSIMPTNIVVLVSNESGYEAQTPTNTVEWYDGKIPAHCLHTYFDYACAVLDDRHLGLYKITG